MGNTIFGYVEPSGITVAVETVLSERVATHGGQLVEMIVSRPQAGVPSWALREADGWVLELCACVTYIGRLGSTGYQVISNDLLSHAGQETTLPDERALAKDHEDGRRAAIIADLVAHFEHEFDAIFGLDEPEITYTPASASCCCLCGREIGPRDWVQAHYVRGSSQPQIACSCVLRRSEVSRVA